MKIKVYERMSETMQREWKGKYVEIHDDGSISHDTALTAPMRIVAIGEDWIELDVLDFDQPGFDIVRSPGSFPRLRRKR